MSQLTREKHDKHHKVTYMRTSDSGQDVNSNNLPRCAASNILSGQRIKGFQRCPAEEGKYKKVGHYIIGARIAGGTYGDVRLAVHLTTAEKVAITVVAKKTLVQCAAAQRQFRREALLLQRVQHPNIVRLYDIMETCSSYYQVLELVTGGHLLGRLLDRGCQTEEECRKYLRQIVSALDHLHESHIVHRNLRLENMLLDTQDNIKLSGFGFCALSQGRDCQLSTQCGSPLYAAPEVIAGKMYGKPVDIWSLGVCLFAMLVGRLPFLPESSVSLFQLHMLILKGCHLPGHLSSECDNLIKKMLELDDSRRITANGMISHPWLLTTDGQLVRRVPAVQTKRQGHVGILGPTNCTMATPKFASSSFLKGDNEVGMELLLKEISSTELSVQPIKSSEKLPVLNRWGNPGSHILGTDKVMDRRFSQNSLSGISTVTCRTLSTDNSQTSYKSHILRLKHSRLHLLQDTCPNYHRNSECVLLDKLSSELHKPEDMKLPMIIPSYDSTVPMTSYEEINAQMNSLSDLSLRKDTAEPARNNDFDVKDTSLLKHDQKQSEDYQSRKMCKLLQDSHEVRSPCTLVDVIPKENPPTTHENSTPHHKQLSSTTRFGPVSSSYDMIQKPNEKSQTITFGTAAHVNSPNISQSKNARSMKSLPRSLFSLLRDPFGKRTWNKPWRSKYQAITDEGRGMSHCLFNSEDGTKWVENTWDQGRIPVSFLTTERSQVQQKLSPENLHVCYGNLSECYIHNTTDTMTSCRRIPGIDTPETDTPGIDSPERREIDLEDFLLPVTRVVITTAEKF